jgi:cytochrome b
LPAAGLPPEAGFEWTQTHFYFGYTALALVLFRLTWGVFGTLHSRYASFVVSPMRVFRYLKNVGSNPTSAGHNPLGGWASALIVGLIGLQASLGLFISDDIFYAGPYNSVVSDHTADSACRLAPPHLHPDTNRPSYASCRSRLAYLGSQRATDSGHVPWQKKSS